MSVKNRMVMAPMAISWIARDGSVTQTVIDYFKARAKAEVGLIIFQSTTVDSSAKHTPNAVGLYDDKFIPGFAKLAETVHTHGAKLAIQLAHPGPGSIPSLEGVRPVGPSPIFNPRTKQICHELTISEIERITQLFGEAAGRAKEAGCDGIELHAAHSHHLVASFLSPLRNKRIDAHGGSLEGRLKFPIEIIKSIRAEAGHDFPVIMRISGDELVPGGMTIRDVQFMAPMLVDAGVDAFDVSAGILFAETFWRVIPPTGSAECLNVHYAKILKDTVNVPIITVGRINDPLLAEDILENNQADMVAIGRALLADPEFPRKALEGRYDDIAPCIGCGLGCTQSRRELGGGTTCLINPALGKEVEMTIVATEKPKRILVAGGGPGGLEAARVAALRGNQVTLIEKDSKLGGQFNLAAVPPLKQELTRAIKYLSTQVYKAGVEVQLNQEVTPQLVEQLNPDAVIVATGSVPDLPSIPGIHRSPVITAQDVLTGKITVQANNVLIIGGGMVGCEIADLLAERSDNPIINGTNITVVDQVTDIPPLSMTTASRDLLLRRMRQFGVKIIPSATVIEIFEDGVMLQKDGQAEEIRSMDCIILAAGMCPFDPLSEQIKSFVDEIYIIGDAKEPRLALEAISEGTATGRTV